MEREPWCEWVTSEAAAMDEDGAGFMLMMLNMGPVDTSEAVGSDDAETVAAGMYAESMNLFHTRPEVAEDLRGILRKRLGYE